MKRIIAILIFSPLGLYLNFSLAQVDMTIGPEIGYAYDMDNIFRNTKVGIRADQILGERTGLTFGINYIIPRTRQSAVLATPKTASSGSSYPVETEMRNKGWIIHGELKFFFIGHGYEDGFGVFFLGGGGFNLYQGSEQIKRHLSTLNA